MANKKQALKSTKKSTRRLTAPLRALRRFWRGLTKRSRIGLLCVGVALLLLAAFGVLRLVGVGGEDTTPTATLFPGIDREGIAEVVCHTAKGTEYTVKGATYEMPDGYGNVNTYKQFYLITADGVAHGDLMIDSTQLSNFVVGTGKNYVFAPVVWRDHPDFVNDTDAYAAKLRELGFHENTPYYEIASTAGDRYRVLYGIKDVTGEGYYVMLAGDESGTVYATKSAFVGDLLQEEGPESLISPTLFITAQNKYAHTAIQSLALYDYGILNVIGEAVPLGYGVGYTLRQPDGTLTAASARLSAYEGEHSVHRYARERFVEFFVGRKIGECNEVLTFTYPETEDMVYKYTTLDEDGKQVEKTEDYRGKTERYEVVSVDYASTEELRYDMRYLTARILDENGNVTVEGERELSHKFSAYGFTAPDNITSYIPDSDRALAMLEGLIKLTGRVVKVGVDESVLRRYKLNAHKLNIAYPLLDELYGEKAFAPAQTLYVSDATADGKRYLASVHYDLVVEVDAEKVDFLDDRPVEMVDDFMVTAGFVSIQRFQMMWRFAENGWLAQSYSFEARLETVYQKNDDGSYVLDAYGNKIPATDTDTGEIKQQVVALTATPVGGGEVISLDPDIYNQLYLRILYTCYRGEHGLSPEALAEAKSAENRVLLYTMTLTDGTTNYYEFYPISGNRVLVNVKNGAGASYSDRFVVWATDLRDIAEGYRHLMENEPYDYEQRYE